MRPSDVPVDAGTRRQIRTMSRGPSSSSNAHPLPPSPIPSASSSSSSSSAPPSSLSPSSSAAAVLASERLSPPLLFPRRGVTGRSEQRLRRQPRPSPALASPASPPPPLHLHPPLTPVSDTLRGETAALAQRQRRGDGRGHSRATEPHTSLTSPTATSILSFPSAVSSTAMSAADAPPLPSTVEVPLDLAARRTAAEATVEPMERRRRQSRG